MLSRMLTSGACFFFFSSQPDVFYKNFELVEALEKFAKKKGITPTQLSLAYLLAQDPIIMPLPGR
jgi:aryl-alcohol dehydrogenase-like predicted oxidoreductase